jgi:hypothetical protein
LAEDIAKAQGDGKLYGLHGNFKARSSSNLQACRGGVSQQMARIAVFKDMSAGVKPDATAWSRLPRVSGAHTR